MCALQPINYIRKTCWFLEINVCTDNAPYSWKGEGDQVQAHLDCKWRILMSMRVLLSNLAIKSWCWSFHPQQRRFNLGKSWSWKVYIPAAMDMKDVEHISGENFFLWKCNKWSQEVEPKTVWIDKFPKELANSEGLNLRIIWTRREFLRPMIFVATLLVLRK